MVVHVLTAPGELDEVRHGHRPLLDLQVEVEVGVDERVNALPLHLVPAVASTSWLTASPSSPMTAVTIQPPPQVADISRWSVVPVRPLLGRVRSSVPGGVRQVSRAPSRCRRARQRRRPSRPTSASRW
jgi:hypothetical protein